MSEASPEKGQIDLSGLNFGPAWAKEGGKDSSRKKKFSGERRSDQRGGGGRDDRKSKPRNQRSPRDSKFSKDRPQRERKPRQAFVPAEAGVKASIMPIEEGVDNLAKEITASGRTQSVFDLARIVLGARERFKVMFTKNGENGKELFQCTHDDAVFLTEEECQSYAASAEWLTTLYTPQEEEVEAPAGNFQNVAKCGFSGELLGPTSFHGYQEKLVEIHRERFSHMSLEDYKRRIVSESGEEVVEQWRESMKKRTVYVLASDEAVKFETKSAVLQHFKENGFAESFNKTHKAVVPSTIEAKKLSSSLLTNLKEVIADQRRYPGDLASFLCRQLSGRQLAVYKWKGKLHCGPSRPHALPEDLVLADRPKQIYQWIISNDGGGIDQLWKDELPEGIDDQAKLEWYHDLHWLINEGYVVFMNNGRLHPSSSAKKPSQDGEAKKNGKAKSDVKPEAKAKEKTEAKASDEKKDTDKADAKSGDASAK